MLRFSLAISFQYSDGPRIDLIVVKSYGSIISLSILCFSALSTWGAPERSPEIERANGLAEGCWEIVVRIADLDPSDPEARTLKDIFYVRQRLDIQILKFIRSHGSRVPKQVEDELVNLVAFQALENLHEYDPSRPFQTWLFTITKRRIHDYWRSASKDQERDEFLDWHFQPGMDHSALDEAICNETQQRLVEAIKRVSGPRGDLLERYFLKGQGRDEIMEALGLTRYDQFDQTFFRAKKALAEEMGIDLEEMRRTTRPKVSNRSQR